MAFLFPNEYLAQCSLMALPDLAAGVANVERNIEILDDADQHCLPDSICSDAERYTGMLQCIIQRPPSLAVLPVGWNFGPAGSKLFAAGELDDLMVAYNFPGARGYHTTSQSFEDRQTIVSVPDARQAVLWGEHETESDRALEARELELIVEFNSRLGGWIRAAIGWTVTVSLQMERVHLVTKLLGCDIRYQKYRDSYGELSIFQERLKTIFRLVTRTNVADQVSALTLPLDEADVRLVCDSLDLVAEQTDIIVATWRDRLASNDHERRWSACSQVATWQFTTKVTPVQRRTTWVRKTPDIAVMSEAASYAREQRLAERWSEDATQRVDMVLVDRLCRLVAERCAALDALGDHFWQGAWEVASRLYRQLDLPLL